jgi:two-component system osmolarity sensor histidine kinase EnvZ
LLILLSLTTFPTLAAYLIYRRIEPPLRRLSLAANQIEQGQWPPAVPVTGPLEIATVIDAFNRMSATLASDEATRAEMLAGISHDIRTPLTKLRMVTAAPQLFESPTAMAERFAEEIDAVLGQFIDFARSDEEALTPGDLNALLEQLAGGYAGLGHPFTLDLQALPLFHYRPAAIQRLLMNLMQNAVTYGRTGLALHSSVAGKFIVLRIADRGPGAPPHSLERLKQAFQRGPGNNAKGSGLGLAIAERVAREHGGSLVLQPGDGAGLVAIVSLPLTR